MTRLMFEKLMLNPGTELSYRKRIRPSQEMLLSDEDKPLLLNDVKVKVNLSKIDRKKSQQQAKAVDVQKPSSETLKKDLEKTKVELNKILDNVIGDVFKEYEMQIIMNNTKELVNDWVDAAWKKGEEAVLKAEIENFMDDLLANKLCKSLSESVTSEKKEGNSENEVDYIKSLPLEQRININKNLQKTIDYNIKQNDLSSQFNYKKNDEQKFMDNMKALCERLTGVSLDQQELESAIKNIYKTTIGKKLICDSSTQCSTIMQNEEVPNQESLLVTPNLDNLDYTSTLPTLSSQTYLGSFRQFSQRPFTVVTSDISSDTAFPKSTSSITADTSYALESYLSENPSQYIVPSNTPSSYTETYFGDRKKATKARHDMDLALNRRGIQKITLTYKKPEKSAPPISLVKINKNQALQTDSTLACPFANTIARELDKPCKYDFSGPENELIATNYDNQSKQTSTITPEADKTLELLENAKCRLLVYLKTQNSDRHKSEYLPNSSPSYSLDGDGSERYYDSFAEMRNVNVFMNSPFKACRGWCKKQNEQELVLQFPSNNVFQVYPLMFNSVKPEAVKSENSIGYQLKSKLDSLQNIYKEIRESMKCILDVTDTPPRRTSDKSIKESGKIETIDSDLTNTFDDIQSSLSTIEQILNDFPVTISPNNLSKTSSSVSFVSQDDKDKHQTYFTMEHEIERTIKELLKESECIRQTAILSGAKEEVEPPFCFEYMDKIDNPCSICRKIIEELISSSLPEEFNTNKSEELQADINYILNILIVEVEKRTSKYSVVGADEKTRDLQSGDINSNNTSSLFGNRNNNNQMVYFQNSFDLTSKIPKTSFSFGEAPGVYLEVANSNCKTPARQRDGLTVTDNSSPRSFETSRLFNELVNLQSDFNQNIQPTVEWSEDNLRLGEEKSCYYLEGSMQEHATVFQVLENSVPNENGKYCHEMISNKNSLLSNCQDGNKDADDANSNSNKDSKQNANYSNTTQVKKSQKSARLCSNKQGCTFSGATSTKEKDGNTSEEEVYIRDINLDTYSSAEEEFPQTKDEDKLAASILTKDTRTTDDEALMQTLELNQQARPSSDAEYFIPSNMSKRSTKFLNQASFRRTLRDILSSSEEDTIGSSSRRPQNKKKKNELPLVEIIAKTSSASSSDSNEFFNKNQPVIQSDLGPISGNSHIVLRSAEAIRNMKDLLENCTRESLSTINTITEDGSEQVINSAPNVNPEYEGDREMTEIVVRNPRHKFKSTHKLNTPEEIAKIEENVKTNEQLEKKTRTILSRTNNSSGSEYSVSSSTSED